MDFMEYVEQCEKNGIFPLRDKRIVVAAVVVLIVLVAAVGFMLISDGDNRSIELYSSSSEEEKDAEELVAGVQESPSSKFCVYVTGAVVTGGICYLDEGARVADAIEACGGFLPEAAIASVNLARQISDGEHIVIPTIQQLEDQAVQGIVSELPVNSDSQPDASNNSNGRININTATSEQLQTLNGIGQSKAQKIIDHRDTNGPFKSIEGLKDVSGIGDKTFDALKDSICI